jgi:hypothetical protein
MNIIIRFNDMPSKNSFAPELRLSSQGVGFAFASAFCLLPS